MLHYSPSNSLYPHKYLLVIYVIIVTCVGPQFHFSRVIGVTKSAGGSLVELVCPSAGVLVDRHATSEYAVGL